jgi:hypothetical protein
MANEQGKILLGVGYSSPASCEDDLAMTKPGSGDARPQWRGAFCFLALAAALLLSSSTVSLAQTVLRVGHFPNVTHAQGLVAHAFSRQGKGWFEQRLGPDVTIQWFVYNAGPSAIEAILAKSIDLTYVGPKLIRPSTPTQNRAAKKSASSPGRRTADQHWSCRTIPR